MKHSFSPFRLSISLCGVSAMESGSFLNKNSEVRIQESVIVSAEKGRDAGYNALPYVQSTGYSLGCMLFPTLPIASDLWAN